MSLGLYDKNHDIVSPDVLTGLDRHICGEQIVYLVVKQ